MSIEEESNLQKGIFPAIQQNKYRKALKDLDTMAMFAPDNMQVSALKLEIKGLMAKPNESSSS